MGPSYNVAPTQRANVLVSGGSGSVMQVRALSWGYTASLHPAPLINARLETISLKRSFAESFAKRRALVPLDGFYEWHEKTPYFIHGSGQRPFFLAGIWQHDQFCLITQAAEGPLVQLHSRMPLEIPAEGARDWLFSGRVPEGRACWEFWPVSTAVNSPRSPNDARLVAPIQPPPRQLELL